MAKSFWKAYLRGADLRGQDLQKANFGNADLRNADLRGADLRGANFWDADLREADLRGALAGASFVGTDLRGADLREADLDLASMVSTHIDATTKLPQKLRVFFTGTRFKNVSFAGIDLQGTKFETCLTGVSFENADLRGVTFRNCRLDGVNFHRANLAGVRFLRGRYLQEASFHSANLQEADLSGCDLSYASLANADLRGTNLAGANLECCSLEGANLAGANLAGVKNMGGIAVAQVGDTVFVDDVPFTVTHFGISEAVGGADNDSLRGFGSTAHYRSVRIVNTDGTDGYICVEDNFTLLSMRIGDKKYRSPKSPRQKVVPNARISTALLYRD